MKYYYLNIPENKIYSILKMVFSFCDIVEISPPDDYQKFNINKIERQNNK